jgi:LPPG:FO 2-phospho-L-lactate transferase
MMNEHLRSGPVVALCRGIGGAKLALGLYRTLAPDTLTVAVNTGDDFDHLGFKICPDIDTVVYTLAGLSDATRGWDLDGETREFMHALGRLGGERWFMLGDQDLAIHVLRTLRLRSGAPLSQVTADFKSRLGIRATVLPATDDSIRAIALTSEGPLEFQTYFVARQCAPEVKGVVFEGATAARIQPDLKAILANRNLAAVVSCPSNPYLSIDPILAIPGVRTALAKAPAPVVAVSPIVSGKAIKGPTAKIVRELGFPITVEAISDHYMGIIDGLVIDEGDSSELPLLDLPVTVAPTVMTNLSDGDQLARSVLAFAAILRREKVAS